MIMVLPFHILATPDSFAYKSYVMISVLFTLITNVLICVVFLTVSLRYYLKTYFGTV